MADDVNLDDDEIFELLNSEDDMVGALIEELSERAAAVARARVHIRRALARAAARSRSNARPPGFTLASIHAQVYRDGRGLLYGGIRAAEDPSIFLEEPAEQMHEKYPFLTTGLDSLEL